MLSKEQAATLIRATLDELKQLVSSPDAPRLTESDTKAHFVEKYIEALGYQGLADVSREYFVKNSQEFIDYMLKSGGERILAVEAKALQVALTDKAGAQLVQYCSVEGIEWCVLTNGRELRLYNQYLKGALEEKLLMKLDLLAYNSDEEFEAIFEQMWLISKEGVTTPSGIRTWMQHQQLDKAMRSRLLDPTSTIVKSIRRSLADEEIQVTSETVAQWFRTQLATTVTHLIPMDTVREKARVSYETSSPYASTEASVPRSRLRPRTVVRWPELFASGLLKVGDWLILNTPQGEVRARLIDNQGRVTHEGETMSAGMWGKEVRGWSTINIYDHTFVDINGRRVPVQELRRQALTR
jgi:predicted type IV restriction endonuclease